MAGTVGITAVGMFGKGQGGWGLVPVIHGLALIVGSIAWKPAVVEGRIEPREILNLTVVFDHDVIDGAPATRFTRQIGGADRERIWAGRGSDPIRGWHRTSGSTDCRRDCPDRMIQRQQIFHPWLNK